MADARCGFVYSIGTVLADEREACCYRPCVDGRERCEWHLDQDKGELLTSPLVLSPDDQLAESVLRGASLAGETALTGRSLSGSDAREADLRYADLSESDLSDADFRNADLRDADLRSADLRNADLREADLREADLTDVDARGATFESANLENTHLTRTNLRNASIEDARVYEVTFSDTWINAGTELGRECIYESDPDIIVEEGLVEKGIVEADPEEIRADADEFTVHRNEAAAWTYRAFERLCRANSLPERTRWYFIREKEARRKQAWAAGDYTEAIKREASRWVMEYGSNPWRIATVSALVILVWAILYPLSGGLLDTSQDTVFGFRVETPADAPRFYFGTVFLKSLYFSVVTFATLGYGDIQPVGAVARGLATIETIVGSLLTALLVFVLSRIITW